ncbi:MAG: FtsX-like permease family protein [Planctomycetales bacterium]|nr:FtsX-like permease family protein [Planctomycetales bacterium]
MNTPLAWKNITHNKARTAIGVAGVGFAVILIFMQIGFKGAIKKTATQIYDALEFDLMLRSPAYLHLTEPRYFPRSRVYQAASLQEVEHARPFYLGLSEWQAPISHEIQATDKPADPDDPAGQWRSIITMGTEPYNPAFKRDDICKLTPKLSDPRFVLVDSESKPEYGPVSGTEFTAADIGVETSLGPERVSIVGLFRLGTGMASNGACLTSPEGYVRACPWQTLDEVNFGLLKLRNPNSAASVKRKLQQMFGIPEQVSNAESFKNHDAATLTNVDVEILTREEVNAHEEYRWVVDTPLGQIFQLGVYVALFVGVAIVYQVLSSDIANMMGEYATLKAMGYSNKYLTRVVLEQSILLAIVGYLPSLLVSTILYEVVEAESGMPMFMTWQIMLSVLLLAIGMCVASGLGALRKLYQADPADLF